MSGIEDIERGIFERWGVRPVSQHVKVGCCTGGIYTTMLPAREDYGHDPILLIHGFGMGSAFWAPNLYGLSAHHTVYTIDLPGFARSGRPDFEDDETLVELEMVQCIEEWREAVGLPKMFIVAHSFAAFFISSYALEHPCRIAHLFLVDPWGFPEKPQINTKQIDPSLWYHCISRLVSWLNPFALLRLTGPYSATVLRRMRPDLRKKFSNGQTEGTDDIYEYLAWCNSHYPSGELAYKSIIKPDGWAKRPIIKRFGGIDDSVCTTFIYGCKSFVDSGPAVDIQQQRAAPVDIQVLRGAGHLVNVDAVEDFNRIILTVVNEDNVLLTKTTFF